MQKKPNLVLAFPSLLTQLKNLSAEENDHIIDTLIKQLKDDVQSLLNAKKVNILEYQKFEEFNTSINNYGLNDFSQLSSYSPANKELICERIKETINQFEPRLSNVKVTIIEAEDEDKVFEEIFTLNFRITAMLYSEPEAINIQFDSRLNPVQQKFSVQDLYND